MSVLRRIFGVQSAQDARARADALFEREEYGSAKLAYERAFDKAKSEDDELRRELRDRIDACCDGIAKQRIAEAEQHIAQGHTDLARQELEGAVEVAVQDSVTRQAQQLLDSMERQDAVESAPEQAEITNEERLAVIAGSWVEPQAAEYESYGERLERAVLALHDERASEARETLEALLAETEEPRYLWLELGRARLLTDDIEAGTEALRRFLDELQPEEGGEARLAAHLELARLADENEDFDGAVAQYQEAIEALGGDPRPYLWLGRYLRLREHPEEAVEVIESGLQLLDEAQPDWRIMQELGLAQAQAGHDEAAIDTFESVIRVFTTRRSLDFPATTTTTLAGLHEKRGNVERAADLYRMLTQGSDADNHPQYYIEAARLLTELGATDEAHRMLQRASALTETDPDQHEQVQARLAALEEP